jgi:hypothetical protein
MSPNKQATFDYSPMRMTILEIQRHQWESIFLAICNHQVASSKPAVGTRIQQEKSKTYKFRLVGLFFRRQKLGSDVTDV